MHRTVCSELLCYLSKAGTRLLMIGLVLKMMSEYFGEKL